MCFSTTASFVASGGLVAIGSASLAVAKKEDKIIAVAPLMFGIQQAFEGSQWLYLSAGYSSLFAGYGFLFFAFVVWPIYVPLAVFILDKKRRSVLKWFVFLGIAVAAYYVYVLSTQALSIAEFRSCVKYDFHVPHDIFASVAYLSAIFAPLLFSRLRFFKWFGAAVIVLAFVAWLFFAFAFTSVWCFFAAIVSSMFFVYILKKNRNHSIK